MTMTSFAIILYGHCCRRHVERQRIVSYNATLLQFVVVGAFVACVLNQIILRNMLLRLLAAVLVPNTICPTTWRRVLGDHRWKI